MAMLNVSSYRHTQSTPATVWNIVHNLGGNGSAGIPVVDAIIEIDSQITKVLPSRVEIIDVNTVELEFTSAFAGTAIVVV